MQNEMDAPLRSESILPNVPMQTITVKPEEINVQNSTPYQTLSQSKPSKLPQPYDNGANAQGNDGGMNYPQKPNAKQLNPMEY
jgi:hypothetical protein